MKILKNLKYYFYIGISTSTLFYIIGFLWNYVTFFSSSRLFVYIIKAVLVPKIIIAILFFVFVFILIHIIWSFILTAIYISVKDYFQKSQQSSIRLLVFFIYLLWMIGFNTYFYPLSKTALTHIPFISSPIFLATIPLVSIIFVLFKFPPTIYKLQIYKTAAISIVTLSIVILIVLNEKIDYVKKQTNRSNVIVIGIDSLRPDHLNINGFSPAIVPNIDSFIDGSQLINNTYTPNARTSASWISMLTGSYPLTTGARFNLTPLDLIDYEDSIAKKFQQEDYYTMYAIDQRKFNNIDESFGFNKVIGPPANVADFILGPLGDLPIINMISQTVIGKYLFPYYYNNRESYWNYKPLQFVDSISESLESSGEKPLLLMTHFVLPHFPFVNQGMRDFEGHPEAYREKQIYVNYLKMLQLVDAQFEYLIDSLTSQGILDNAHVFIISDHGDSYKLDRDAISQGDKKSFFNVISYGHGTNVSDIAQYKTVFAYKAFGTKSKKMYSRDVNSLIDLPVSLCHGILTNCNMKSDGENLFSMQGEIDSAKSIFLESSLNIAGLDSEKINALDLLDKGISFYEVNNDGKVVIKRKLLEILVSSKQRSIVRKRWRVSFYPAMTEEYIFIDDDQKKWWPASLYEGEAPINEMKNELCMFFKNDLGMENFKFCKLE